MIYTCCDQNRRALVDAHATLNGIDWLEVLDLEAPPGSPRQRTLLVRLLKAAPAGLTPDNVRIQGGTRIRRIAAEWVGIAGTPPAEATPQEQSLLGALPDADRVLVIRTDTTGDFSTYRLSLVSGGGSDAELPGFDPRLSSIDFAFKVECPTDFDCEPRRTCSKPPQPAPDLSYLARDYASLRRMLIDRLSSSMPGWTDQSPADLATTLAEVLAYVGDQQHYQLDAVTTEAYLHTARRRTSLRRHAVLVDYTLHEGSNARTWVHLDVSGGPFALPAGIRFYTRVAGVPPRIVPDSPQERAALMAAPLTFEPMHEVTLRQSHNEMFFHTWGDQRCCLPIGATSATLRGHFPDLAIGDVLVFVERLGPLTGQASDRNPAQRHAVRLTQVRAHAGTQPLTDPVDATEITEISWDPRDALPFPLCLSSETDSEHGQLLLEDVSVALGNNVLCDHGRTIENEALGEVPKPRLQYPKPLAQTCQRVAARPLPPRFRPPLANRPLTYQGTVRRVVVENGARRTERVPFNPSASATDAMTWKVSDARPQIALTSHFDASVNHWSARPDLLSSHAADTHFVVETENDGSARLRFGDDRHGRRPDTGTVFTASYRVGNGPEGNVGADSITHAVTSEDRIQAVTNPLPARGGQAPETAAQVRRRAPHAFRTQERAVTPADYAEVTGRMVGVQRAAASLRWTGSWHTVFVTVDREGGVPVDADFEVDAREHLERYRMAGHDVKIHEPVHVSLEIDLMVCVDAGYFRSDVRRGLLEVLSNRVLADGTLGLFHPDNFSFGHTVFLSPIYARARSVPGVVSVQITRFQRQGTEDPKPLQDGFMRLERLEIPRLDNDRNFPEHGVLRLDLHGGK